MQFQNYLLNWTKTVGSKIGRRINPTRLVKRNVHSMCRPPSKASDRHSCVVPKPRPPPKPPPKGLWFNSQGIMDKIKLMHGTLNKYKKGSNMMVKTKENFYFYLHNLEINFVTVIIKGQLPLHSCRKTISKWKI